MFRHPKYYKELRKLRNKLDQVISDEASTEATSVHPGPGPKQAASDSSSSTVASFKQQASSSKRIKHQATSVKPQAASFKLQATSFKLQDLRTTEKFHGA
jgi:hypothetical protein